MSRIIALLALCILPLATFGCEKVPLTAPTDSSITLSIVDNTTVPLNGSLSVTAIVMESGGTPVHNGTSVTFVTNLGTMEPMEVQTRNGLATSTFRAGSRSGTARLRAFSGGAGIEEEAVADVLVGGAAEGIQVLLRTEALTPGGTNVTIVATVLDADGNPLPGQLVVFTAPRGTLSPGQATTDSIGEARTRLATSQNTTVTATSGSANSTIDVAAPGTITLTTPGVTAGTPFQTGVPITFELGVTNSTFFNNVTIDFGDGEVRELGTVAATRQFQKVYNTPATYTVKATATSATGVVTPVSLIIQVNERTPATVAVTTDPANGVVSIATQQGIVRFTATLPTGLVALSYNWEFGEGTSLPTVANTAQHRYIAPGTYTAKVTVQTTDGRSTDTSVLIRVTP